MPIRLCAGCSAGFSRRTRPVARAVWIAPALPILLAGVIVLPGCRSDQASRPALAGLSPARWIAGDSDSDDDDDFTLRPVPQGAYQAPPVPPPDPPARGFLPARPAEDAGSFYGVRPTGAEEEQESVRPNWTDRFRKLFRRPAAEEHAPLQPVPDRRSASMRHWPPAPFPVIRPRAVALDPPVAMDPSAELARHIEPQRGLVIRQAERLPVVVPRAVPPIAVAEPAPWPHRPANRPLLASRSAPPGRARVH